MQEGALAGKPSKSNTVGKMGEEASSMANVFAVCPCRPCAVLKREWFESNTKVLPLLKITGGEDLVYFRNLMEALKPITVLDINAGTARLHRSSADGNNVFLDRGNQGKGITVDGWRAEL